MIGLLLFLFPAGFALKVKDDFFGEDMKTKDYVLTYMKYTVIINLIMFGVLYLYNANKPFIFSVSLDDIGFILKYAVITFVLAIIVPVVDEFLRKFINFKLIIRKVSDGNEKKTSK
ncbi:MAG: hypothetical protein IJE89_01290 [Bacilli bacterium]|nr:hypothetical protein [Bacilli bacterium]